MKKIIILIVVVLVAIFVYPKSYISSPGHVTAEMYVEFERTAPSCLGYSYLTNGEAMAADAPGKSLCFGWLKKNSTLVTVEAPVVSNEDNWKTYQNSKFGVTFKYPSNLAWNGDGIDIKRNDFACKLLVDFAEVNELEKNKGTDNDIYTAMSVCLFDGKNVNALNNYKTSESEAVLSVNGYKVLLFAPASILKEVSGTFKSIN